MVRPALCLALGVVALVLVSAAPSAAQGLWPQGPQCDGLPWYEIQAFDHHHAYDERDLAFWGCQEEPSATPGPIGKAQRYNNTWWDIWRPENGAAPSGNYVPPNYDASWVWSFGASFSGGGQPVRGAGELYEYNNNGIPIYSPGNGTVVDGLLPVVGDSTFSRCQDAASAKRQPADSIQLLIDYHNWYLLLMGLNISDVRVGDEVTRGQRLGRASAQGWGQTGFSFAGLKEGTGFAYDVFDPFGWNQDTLGLKDEPLFPGFDHHFTSCDISSERKLSPLGGGGSGPCYSSTSDCPEAIIIDNEPVESVDFWYDLGGDCTTNSPPFPDECTPDCGGNPGMHGVYESKPIPGRLNPGYENDYHWSVSWFPNNPDQPNRYEGKHDEFSWACWECDTSKPIHVSASIVGYLGEPSPGLRLSEHYDGESTSCFRDWWENRANMLMGGNSPGGFPRFYDFPGYQARFQTFQVFGFTPPAGKSWENRVGPGAGVFEENWRYIDTVTVDTVTNAGKFADLGVYKFLPAEVPVVSSTNVVGLSADGKYRDYPFAFQCEPWLTNYAVFDAVKFTAVCSEPDIIRDPDEPVPIVTKPPGRWTLPTSTPVLREATIAPRTVIGAVRWNAPDTPTPRP